MKSATQKTVLITGVTSGLGRSLAKECLALNWKVVGLGKRARKDVDQDLLTSISYIQVDLSNEEEIERISDELKNLGLNQLDCIIHNAGTAYYGEFAKQSEDSIHNNLTTNLWAPIRITQLLLPLVRKSKGQVVFISSLMSGLKTPDYAIYTATKSALDRFAKDLAIEEKDNAVSVLLKRPGAMKTSLHRKIGFDTSGKKGFRHPDYVARKMIDQMLQNEPTQYLFSSDRLVFTALKSFQLGVGFLAFLKKFIKGKSRANTALITGAADGIGKALILEYARKLEKLYLVDRNGFGLEKLKRNLSSNPKLKIEAIPEDLISPNLPEVLIEKLKDQPKTMIFHNAGVNYSKPFSMSSREELKQMFEVNVKAPILITRKLLGNMKNNHEFKFIFTSSLSHFVSYPGSSFYSATKDAVYSFSKGIRGVVDTATICPGPTETKQARSNSPHPKNKRVSANLVAKRIGLILSFGVPLVIPGIGIALMAFWASLFESLSKKMMTRLIWNPIKSKYQAQANPEKLAAQSTFSKEVRKAS